MTQRIGAFWLGTLAYDEADRLQQELAARRAAGQIGDLLLLLEHSPVITLGRGGGEEEILGTPSDLRRAGIGVARADRGGRATDHGPGQLVVYPILEMARADLHAYVERLEEVAIRVLGWYGLAAGRLEGMPGAWIAGRKIAAVGVSVRDGVTRHGLALNVSPCLEHFRLLVPCGIADREITSMQREMGSAPKVEEVARQLRRAFGAVFSCEVIEGPPGHLRAPGAALARPERADEQPGWLWQPAPAGAEPAVERMERLLADLALHTVCREAGCPNLAECFGQGTATFLLLGSICTRGCRFCAVTHGRPAAPDGDEPARVAEAAGRLGLKHVVLTSVTRDDLPDGGAGHFAAAVRVLHERLPQARVEVLIPDFQGSCAAVEAVLAAGPDVVNHNLETVPRLYPLVRPGAEYRRSLSLVAWSKARAPRLLTKSGLMLGLGERTAEVLRVLDDLRRAGCDLLTLGQYLRPDDRKVPVARYVSAEEFAWYRARAEAMGFRGVASAPLVRSSHQAAELWQRACQSADG